MEWYKEDGKLHAGEFLAVSGFNKDGDDSLILYSSRYSRSCPSCVLCLGSRAAALSSSVDVASARTRIALAMN